MLVVLTIEPRLRPGDEREGIHAPLRRAHTLLALALALPAPGAGAGREPDSPDLMKQGDAAYRNKQLPARRCAWEAIYFYKEVLKIDRQQLRGELESWRGASTRSPTQPSPSNKRKKELGAEGLKHATQAAQAAPGRRIEGWFYGVIMPRRVLDGHRAVFHGP